MEMFSGVTGMTYHLCIVAIIEFNVIMNKIITHRPPMHVPHSSVPGMFAVTRLPGGASWSDGSEEAAA